MVLGPIPNGRQRMWSPHAMTVSSYVCINPKHLTLSNAQSHDVYKYFKKFLQHMDGYIMSFSSKLIIDSEFDSNFGYEIILKFVYFLMGL